MNKEKGVLVDTDKSELDELSTASSVLTARVIQVQVESPPLTLPSLSLSDATTAARNIFPISSYFRVHEPLASYQSDRETILRNPESGLEETHLLRNVGIRDVYFTEEHYSSVIKSFQTNTPPKFKQILKAYRVQSTDRLVLFVEVLSQPPAIFQWFYNERPATGDTLSNNKFMIRHGTNVSTLTVEGPDQGVYSCSAQNPVGVSKSYGYITIDDSKSYKNTEKIETLNQTLQKTLKRRPPKFLNQIPHFVLKPSDDALIDIEVESTSLPINFAWYVDGKKIDMPNENVTFYTPKCNRCVAKFKFPLSGQYTVVASNEFGAAKSTGYIEVQRDLSCETHLNLLKSYFSSLPPQASGAVSPLSSAGNHGVSTTKPTVKTIYLHRASSLPRTQYSNNQENVRFSRKSQTPEHTHEDFYLDSRVPQAPVFITRLPDKIILQLNEKLVLTAEVLAVPSAKILWKFNDESVENLQNYKLLNKTNRSTLVVEPPINIGLYSVSAFNAIESVTEQQQTIVNVIIASNETDTEKLSEIGQDQLATEIIKNSVEQLEDNLTKTEMISKEVVEEKNEFDHEDDKKMFIKTYTDLLCANFSQDLSPNLFNEDLTFSSALKQRQATPPRELIPIIISSPERQIFVPGGLPLILDLCFVSTTPAKVRWYYQNFEIRPISGIKIEELELNSRLIYDNPLEGVYKAVVSNQFGIANFDTRVLVEIPGGRQFVSTFDEEAPAFMRRKNNKLSEISVKMNKRGSIPPGKNINKPPKLVQKPNAVYRIKNGNQLVLEAVADAHPEADFLWRQNNFETHNGKLCHIFRVAENHSRAVFDKPVGGRYEVVAKNHFGTHNAFTKIIIEYEELANLSKSEYLTSPIVGQEKLVQSEEVKLPEESAIAKTTVQLEVVSKQKEVNRLYFINELSELLPQNGEICEGSKLCIKMNLKKFATDNAQKNCLFKWFLNNQPISTEFYESTYNSTTLCIPTNVKMCGELLVSVTTDKATTNSFANIKVVSKDVEKLVKPTINIKNQQTTSVVERENILDKEKIDRVKESVVPVDKSINQIETNVAPDQKNLPSEIINAVDESVVIARKNAIEDQNISLAKEDFAETTSIKKEEESYSLLIKVAESLAQTLVAKIVVTAIKKAANQLIKTKNNIGVAQSKDEKDFEFVEFDVPIFETNNELFTVNDGTTVTITAKYNGEQCHIINWYYDNTIIKESDSIKFENNASLIKLILSNFDAKSVGEYKCVVKNNFGSALYVCTLNQKDTTNESKTIYTENSDDENGEYLDTQIFINHKEDVFDVSVIIEVPEMFLLSANQLCKKISKFSSKYINQLPAEQITDLDTDADADAELKIKKPEDSKNLVKSVKQLLQDDTSIIPIDEKSVIETVNLISEATTDQIAPFVFATLDDFELKSDDELTSKELEDSAIKLANDFKKIEEDLALLSVSPINNFNVDFIPVSHDETKDLKKDSRDNDNSDDKLFIDKVNADLIFNTAPLGDETILKISVFDLKNQTTRKPTKVSPQLSQENQVEKLLTSNKLFDSFISNITEETLDLSDVLQHLLLSLIDDTFTTSSSVNPGQAPKFIQKLYNAEFLLGKKAQLKCIVTGNPIPEVAWFVDGNQIYDSNDYKIVYEDSISLLCFHNIIPENEGEYLCTAYNTIGKAFTKCFVKIENSSKILKSRWTREIAKSVNLHDNLCQRYLLQF